MKTTIDNVLPGQFFIYVAADGSYQRCYRVLVEDIDIDSIPYIDVDNCTCICHLLPKQEVFI